MGVSIGEELDTDFGQLLEFRTNTEKPNSALEPHSTSYGGPCSSNPLKFLEWPGLTEYRALPTRRDSTGDSFTSFSLLALQQACSRHSPNWRWYRCICPTRVQTVPRELFRCSPLPTAAVRLIRATSPPVSNFGPRRLPVRAEPRGLGESVH